MKKFLITPNRKKIYIVIGILAILAVCLFFASFMGAPYPGIFQTLGVLILVAVLLLYNIYGCGSVEVRIDDERDKLSIFPKLYIYTVKGNHNISQTGVVIPFNRIESVEKTGKPKKVKGIQTQFLIANFRPNETYTIIYKEAYSEMAVVCDFGKDALDEITHRVELFSGLKDDDEI